MMDFAGDLARIELAVESAPEAERDTLRTELMTALREKAEAELARMRREQQREAVQLVAQQQSCQDFELLWRVIEADGLLEACGGDARAAVAMFRRQHPRLAMFVPPGAGGQDAAAGNVAGRHHRPVDPEEQRRENEPMNRLIRDTWRGRRTGEWRDPWERRLGQW